MEETKSESRFKAIDFNKMRQKMTDTEKRHAKSTQRERPIITRRAGQAEAALVTADNHQDQEFAFSAYYVDRMRVDNC
jgi:hypothetical protein